MIRIAHISDIHFGAADPASVEGLLRAVEAAAPQAVVATGDITQSGRRREFAEAAQFFSRLSAPQLIIAGNHDAPVFNLWMRFVSPWRRLHSALRSPGEGVLDLEGARIIGLNSARRAGLSLDWSLGRLSKRQLADAGRTAREAEQGHLRVVAVHHPLRRTEGSKAAAAVVGNAGDALAAFAGAGVDVILTGHTHVSSATTIRAAGRNMVLCAAGTAASTRGRGEAPSFNLIDHHGDALSVAVFPSTPGSAVRKVRFLRSHDGWRADGTEERSGSPRVPSAAERLHENRSAP